MPGTSPYGGGLERGEGHAAEPRWGVAERMRRVSRLPAGVVLGIAVSLFLHVVLALLAALAVLNHGGNGETGRGEIELAIMTDAELTEFVRGEIATHEPITEQLEIEDVFITESINSAGSLSALASLDASDLGDIGLVSGGGEGFDGSGAMSGGAMGGTAARFFGVEAKGSRFAYVIDISGSMDDARMSALKREVITSISGLLDHAKFTVVTYNSEAESLTGGRWFVADERSKRETGSEIGGLVSSGGTEPSHAFGMVSRMRPKADAIYFMTDGKIAGEEEGKLIRRINMMNRSGGVRTRVHCITFMNKDSEKFMRRIARMTGGTYMHVGGGER